MDEWKVHTFYVNIMESYILTHTHFYSFWSWLKHQPQPQPYRSNLNPKKQLQGKNVLTLQKGSHFDSEMHILVLNR